jgi:hypothetical protein
MLLRPHPRGTDLDQVKRSQATSRYDHSGTDALRCGAGGYGVHQMEERDLRNLLTQLHARLGSAESLDADDRQLLATVLRDIEAVLAKSGTAQPPSTSGLESLAVKFEADHPALAESLRQLVDGLAKAGI